MYMKYKWISYLDISSVTSHMILKIFQNPKMCKHLWSWAFWVRSSQPAFQFCKFLLEKSLCSGHRKESCFMNSNEEWRQSRKPASGWKEGYAQPSYLKAASHPLWRCRGRRLLLHPSLARAFSRCPLNSLLSTAHRTPIAQVADILCECRSHKVTLQSASPTALIVRDPAQRKTEAWVNVAVNQDGSISQLMGPLSPPISSLFHLWFFNVREFSLKSDTSSSSLARVKGG